MKITGYRALCLLLLCGPFAACQVKFDISLQGLYIVTDTINNTVYSFDTGSESSNLFNRDKFDYGFGGITLVTNASGKPKLIKKGHIKSSFAGLGSVRTNANILGDKKFSESHCLDFDILLGTKALKKHLLCFNNNTRTLTPLGQLPSNIAQYQKLELTSGFFDRRYYTTLEINGKKEEFLVDTAYSGGVLVNDDSHLADKEEVYSVLSLVAFRIEAETTERFVNNEVKHNGTTFKNTRVYYNKNYPNLLGNSFFLSYDEVIFDLKNKSIYLLNEQAQKEVFAGDVFIAPTDEKDFTINFIKHSGPYYRDGYRAGDKVALQDKELEQQLLASPCDTYKIIMDWQEKHNAFPEFYKL